MKTRDKVIAALDKYFLDGKPIPALRTIRQEVGGGSLSMISSCVKEWRITHNIYLPNASKELPSALDQKTSLAVSDAVWDALKPIVAAYLDVQREAFKREHADVCEKYKAIQDENLALKEKNSALEKEIKTLQKMLEKVTQEKTRAESALEVVMHLRKRAEEAGE